MATKTSLVITSTSEGKNLQKTLTDINPAASNSALKTWGEMLTGLTTNTYIKTDRVDKTNCDSAPVKQTPSLIIDPSASIQRLTRSYCLDGVSPPLNYTGDGELSIVANVDGDNSSWCTTIRTSATQGLRLYIGIIKAETATLATAPHTITVRSAETENYEAGEFTFTIYEDE